MFMQLLNELGPWSWFIAGLLLLIGEVLLPGAFLMWFRIAAITIGTLTLAPFTDVSWWPWQVQLVAFGVLSLLLVLIGRKLFPSDRTDDVASGINDPLGKFVGREATLLEPIADGYGRVKLGDTLWRVRGSDLPAGSKVRVTGVDDGTLMVEQT